MSANKVEKLAYWYLRFNGYLTVENFTVHPDHKKNPETEADILAVRFPRSKEEPEGYHFERDKVITLPDKIDFVICEVKSGLCALNENSWGNPIRRHIEYALDWMGFLPDATDKKKVAAETLYNERSWYDEHFSIRFVCFGKDINEDLSIAYPKMLQITHSHVMVFVYRRLTTYCNSLHRENWEPFIKEIVNLIESGQGTDELLRWTLSEE